MFFSNMAAISLSPKYQGISESTTDFHVGPILTGSTKGHAETMTYWAQNYLQNDNVHITYNILYFSECTQTLVTPNIVDERLQRKLSLTSLWNVKN